MTIDIPTMTQEQVARATESVGVLVDQLRAHLEAANAIRATLRDLRRQTVTNGRRSTAKKAATPRRRARGLPVAAPDESATPTVGAVA